MKRMAALSEKALEEMRNVRRRLVLREDEYEEADAAAEPNEE